MCLHSHYNSRTGQSDAVAATNSAAAPMATVQTSVEAGGTVSDLSAHKPMQDGKSLQPQQQQPALAQSVVASLKLAPAISLLVSFNLQYYCVLMS
jgi:hypothetical protein